MRARELIAPTKRTTPRRSVILNREQDRHEHEWTQAYQAMQAGDPMLICTRCGRPCGERAGINLSGATVHLGGCPQ